MSLQLSHAFANINFYCSFNDKPQILMAVYANTRCCKQYCNVVTQYSNIDFQDFTGSKL